MKLTKIGKPALWRSLAAVSGVLLALAVGGTAVTTEWSGYINKYLGISNTTIVEGDSDEDPIHYKSDFTNYTDVMENARSVAKQVQAEGTVLMTNKNNALPLAEKSNVTFFGYNQVSPAYGSSGSGGITPTEERQIDLKDACAAGGDVKLNMNTAVYDFYQQNYDNKVGFTESQGWGGTTLNFRTANASNELNADTFTDDVRASYDDYSDAAVYVMTRIGGEGNDPSAANDYLALTENERSVLQTMKDGPFKKRIVLLNTFNTPELGWLDEYDIDAVLHIGGPGEVGLDAVTDILVGRTNPSGRLADTYATDAFSSPAMQNFGDFTFANADSIVNSDSRKYLMYNEGIYVGYRYYETRYEDTVLGNGNASSPAGIYASSGNEWDYSEEVMFPFGYGLSYSEFSQTLDNVNVDWNNKTATVTVTVTNESGMAGKDVVEVYAQAPYTAGGVEKSAVQLCGFAKTEELEEGDSETVTITVDLADIASYDYENYKTYIMDEGDYYFAIGNGAHEALNNILAAKGYDTSDGMDANGDGDKAYMSTKTSFDPDEYRLSSQNTSVTNQFDNANINTYDEDAVTYLSRSDWSGTWPETMENFTATQSMIDEAASYYSAATDGSTSPAAYEKGSSDTSSITLGAEPQYTLAMMIGADYDDPAWDLLLDQLTVQDYLDSTSQGRKELKSVGLNATTAVDGPAAWTKSTYITDYTKQYDAEEVEKTDEQMVLYPIETVFASTWNVELIEAVGDSFGEEGLWGGGVGWYGPGANTHRTPYGGRNFEYFSEDGFLSGKLCEAEVHGAMAKGTICYLKHFFLNDQETNRIGVCTFSNEQAIREIYLRAFEYAFETTGDDDPACNGVMGGFNRLGMTWTGHHSNLWKNVMENEWGFLGNVTTDFGQKQGSLMEPQLAYEAGTHMFCTSGTGFANYLSGLDITKDLKLLTNMREALHRQLYNFANSAAMNGLTSDSQIVTVRTWYENALLAATIITAVVLAGSGAMTILQAVFSRKDEKKEKEAK